MTRYSKRQTEDDDESSSSDDEQPTKTDSTTDDADQAEPPPESEETKDSGAAKNPDETAIDVESAEEPATAADPAEEKKSNTVQWVVIAVVLFALIGAAIGAGIYFALMKPATKPVDEPKQNQTAPSCPPPPSSFKWIKDVEQDSRDGFQYFRYNLFSGMVTYWRMRTYCNRINMALNRSDSARLGINSRRVEALVDAAVRNHSDAIFSSVNETQRFLWTDLIFYGFEKATHKWQNTFVKDGNGTIRYTNFCDPYWEDEINLNKEGFERFIVIKDYRGNRIDKNETACWRLVGWKRGGLEPKFAFLCSTLGSTEVTGKVAEKGIFDPKVEMGNYIGYGLPATYSEAAAECKSQGAHLVAVDTLEKHKELFKLDGIFNFIRHTFRSNDTWDLPWYSWTGGFYDQNSIDLRPQWLDYNSSNSNSTWNGPGWCNRMNQTVLKKHIDDALAIIEQQPQDCRTRSRILVMENFFNNRTNYISDWSDCWHLFLYEGTHEDDERYFICEKD